MPELFFIGMAIIACIVIIIVFVCAYKYYESNFDKQMQELIEKINLKIKSVDPQDLTTFHNESKIAIDALAASQTALANEIKNISQLVSSKAQKKALDDVVALQQSHAEQIIAIQSGTAIYSSDVSKQINALTASITLLQNNRSNNEYVDAQIATINQAIDILKKSIKIQIDALSLTDLKSILDKLQAATTMQFVQIAQNIQLINTANETQKVKINELDVSIQQQIKINTLIQDAIFRHTDNLETNRKSILEIVSNLDDIRINISSITNADKQRRMTNILSKNMQQAYEFMLTNYNFQFVRGNMTKQTFYLENRTARYVGKDNLAVINNYQAQLVPQVLLDIVPRGPDAQLVKRTGNNGTVTCQTYCQGAMWGGQKWLPKWNGSRYVLNAEVDKDQNCYCIGTNEIERWAQPVTGYTPNSGGCGEYCAMSESQLGVLWPEATGADAAFGTDSNPSNGICSCVPSTHVMRTWPGTRQITNGTSAQFPQRIKLRMANMYLGGISKLDGTVIPGLANDGNIEPWMQWLYLPDKTIRNMSFGTCITMQNANAPAVLVAYNGSTNQSWNYNPTTGAFINHANTTMCLDNSYGSLSVGNQLGVYGYAAGNKNQIWDLRDV